MLLVNPEVIKFMFLTSKYSRRPDLEVCIRKLNIWLRKQGEKKKESKGKGKQCLPASTHEAGKGVKLRKASLKEEMNNIRKWNPRSMS